MALVNGRGDENKRRILRQYRLHPIMHTLLLNGKRVKCCCGETLNAEATDAEYHLFDAMDTAGKAVNVLYAGNGCAGSLQRLSQESGATPITLLPLFNPLQPVLGGGGGGGGYGPGLPGNHVRMAPINAEIEQAINLTLICWNSAPKPGSVFSKLLEEIRQFPGRPLFDFKVKSVNTAIGSGARSLTAMLAALHAENPTLRQYAFPEMTAVLQRLQVHGHL